MSELNSSLARALVDEQGLDIIIPNIYTSIGDYAFFEKNITSVVIPNSITSIGSYAFRDNLLTSVVIPDSVTSIGDYAFGFNYLTTVVIGDGVTWIDYSAFSVNQLTSVVIGDSVTSIGDYAFGDNLLTNVVIPDSVTSIGRTAFYENQLTSVVIGDSVTSIGDYAFGNNPLTSVSISEDTTFDLSLLPEGIEIDTRGVNDSQTEEGNDGNENIIYSPKKFKNKFVDKITNFNPSTDTLEIDTDSFGINSSATFAAGKNKKAVKKQLAKQDIDFLYDEKKGGLYFNENGADKGFGDGGIIAILKGAPELTANNLEFI